MMIIVLLLLSWCKLEDDDSALQKLVVMNKHT